MTILESIASDDQEYQTAYVGLIRQAVADGNLDVERRKALYDLGRMFAFSIAQIHQHVQYAQVFCPRRMAGLQRACDDALRSRQSREKEFSERRVIVEREGFFEEYQAVIGEEKKAIRPLQEAERAARANLDEVIAAQHRLADAARNFPLWFRQRMTRATM